MFLITKNFPKVLFIIMLLSIFISGSLYAQTGNYKGSEPNLNTIALLEKAKSTNFDDNISAKIFEDSKNAYYAVDVSKLASEYEQIRFLEFSYANNIVVNTSSNKAKKYYLFLVNNTLNKSEEEINNLFNNFSIQSKEELQNMNNEQVRLWLIQHDKYSK